MTRRASWLWLVSAAMLAVVVGAGFSWLGLEPHDASYPIRWWMLAPLFALAEIFVFHVQIRRETQTFSLSEVPLVLGLFFAAPVELLVAQAVGAGAALILHRRQPVLKTTFNIAQFALTSVAAIAVFRALAALDAPLGNLEIAAAFTAATVAIFTGVAAVMVAISITEGVPPLRVIGRNLAFGGIGTAANTALTLIAVLVLRVDPQAEWLLLLPAFVLVVAYRAYSEQRLRLERLSTLSEATRLVERQVSVEPAMAGVLSNARALLGADLAILQFMGDHAGDPLLEIRDDGSGDVQMLSVEADPRSGVWARVVAENAAVLLSRPIENLRLREHFSTVGIRDAVVVPLPGRHGVIGTLMVANRSGDVETFTAESTKLLETFAHQIGTALENVRLVAKLQLTADQLGEAVRSKDEMLANIAHDMRNPLASVLAGVHLLLDDEALSRDEQQELLRAIAMQGGSLRSLIDEIVGNASESSREPVPVDLPSLLRTVEATTRAAARGHRLEIACDKFLPEVVSDPAAMSRILGNLVTNAFKYSPDGSSVILSVRADSDGHVLFSVSDEGFGIEPEDQSRIFDRFFQADRANNGAGLGLSIASRLAREIGGQLWLAWSDVGRGSEFRFKVPTRALGPVLTIPDQVSKESLDRA